MSDKRRSGPGRGGPPSGRDGADARPRQRPATSASNRNRRAGGQPKPAGAPRQAGPGKPANPRTDTKPTTGRTDGKGDRIAKLLARAGVGSRRDIERMINEGRVAIDGKPLETPATILTSLQGVTVDGRAVAHAEASRLFLFYKPSGVLTAARDPSGRPTIYDVLPQGIPRLMPVGRLDLNTEGLLLLTNDGELKRALELPSSEVPRSYRVRAIGEVRQQALEALAMGMTIDGIRYGSVDASVDRRSHAGAANLWLTMTLTEGKNREVRRLCEGIGLKVSRLIRTAYGPFVLEGLPVRGLREASPAEVETLQRLLRPRGRKPQGN